MMLNEIIHVRCLAPTSWEWDVGKSYEDAGYADHRDRVQGPVVELREGVSGFLGEKRGGEQHRDKVWGIFKLEKRPHSSLCMGAQGCEGIDLVLTPLLRTLMCQHQWMPHASAAPLSQMQCKWSLLHPNHLLTIKTYTFLKLSKNLN